MALFSKIMRPALFRLEGETAHQLTIASLKRIPIPANARRFGEQLETTIAGLKFSTPVGMAAGFDKNGEVSNAVLRLGFGFAEIGSVTPRPQAGNPKPRLFRLTKDEAVINRMGFNNRGHEYALNNLSRDKGTRSGPIGVNIGANKDSQDFIADYEVGISAFWPVADYFTANISSPNTPGLRDLQAKDALNELLQRVMAVRDQLADKNGISRPVFLKISPDLDEKQLDEIAQCVSKSSIDGLVISNTTLARPNLKSTKNILEAGGLSGRPLFEPSTIILAKMRQRVGTKLPIIGVGGIDSAQSAWQKMEAGANLVQLYSAMVYHGPRLASRICEGLADRLAQNERIENIVGTKTDEWANK